MTSSEDRKRREDVALLHAAIERLRVNTRQRQASGADVPDWVWPVFGLLDSCEWAIGRRTLDGKVRKAALEVARKVLADGTS